MSRILALDYGEKNIGIAISDPLNLGALPIGKFQNNSDFISNLKNTISSNNITKIVVGWPINLKGQETQKTKEVGIFIDMIKKETGLEVIPVDERLSSKEAYNYLMISSELSHSKKKKKVDQIAAAIILQKYMDMENMRRKNAP